MSNGMTAPKFLCAIKKCFLPEGARKKYSTPAFNLVQRSIMHICIMHMPLLLSSNCVHDPIDHKMLKKFSFVQTVT
jgi:hypothetical protein